eukprot:4584450-Amphidinium_carterae.1
MLTESQRDLVATMRKTLVGNGVQAVPKPVAKKEVKKPGKNKQADEDLDDAARALLKMSAKATNS